MSQAGQLGQQLPCTKLYNMVMLAHIREVAEITDLELGGVVLLVYWLEVAIPFGDSALRRFSDWPLAEASRADNSQCVSCHDW